MRAVPAQLERLLALSEAMLAAGEAGEWERLAALGEERKAIVDSLPADLNGTLFGPEKVRARTIIERHQVLDAKTRALIEERQQALRVLLREPIA